MEKIACIWHRITQDAQKEISKLGIDLSSSTLEGQDCSCQTQGRIATHNSATRQEKNQSQKTKMTARAHQPPHDRWRPTPIGDMPSAAPAKSKRAIRSERAEHHRVRTEKSAARRRHPRRPARSPIGTAEKESKQGSKRRTKRRTETVASAFLLRKHEPERSQRTPTSLPW